MGYENTISGLVTLGTYVPTQILRNAKLELELNNNKCVLLKIFGTHRYLTDLYQYYSIPRMFFLII